MSESEHDTHPDVYPKAHELPNEVVHTIPTAGEPAASAEAVSAEEAATPLSAASNTSFEWNKDDTREQAGFIAQEINPAAPSKVTEEVEDELPVVERRVGVNPSAEMTKEVFTPLPKGTKVTPTNSVSCLGADVAELNSLSENYRTLDIGRSPESERWATSVAHGQDHMMRGDAFNTTVRRDDALFRQAVTAEGGEQLSAGKPKFGESSDGGRLVGPQAMMKVKGLLNMGTIARIPLWHSGLWVNFKAPSEVDLLELDRRIANEKVLLGRATNGTIFSNTSVYLNSYLINFALAHVYEATYRQVPTQELKELILIPDLPQLIWGLLCTIYPQGYHYRQPCVIDPTKCTHVVEETLNISKLSWTDDRSLTEYQRKHMSQRTAKFTDEQLKRYRDEHAFTSKFATVKLHDGLTMVLKVPTLGEYERGGFKWVDDIIEKVDQAFGGTLVGEDRNRYITEQGSVTALRQYGQWIDKLVLDDGEGVIDDAATIEETISVLTSHEEVYAKFFDSIEAFINNTTISLIAIPKINCPKCEKPMTPDEHRHPHLVPLDVTNVFFTLVDQRVGRLLGRTEK